MEAGVVDPRCVGGIVRASLGNTGRQLLLSSARRDGPWDSADTVQSAYLRSEVGANPLAAAHGFWVVILSHISAIAPPPMLSQVVPADADKSSADVRRDVCHGPVLMRSDYPA